MEVERLPALCRSHRRVAFDTCIFIYQWEANPRYSPLTDLIFSALEESDFAAVTSTVTMTELLVHPYRSGDADRASELFGALCTYPNLEWIFPTLEIAAIAAEIRALHRLRTPDALQAATAVHSKATALITNDPALKRVPGFDVLLLGDFV